MTDKFHNSFSKFLETLLWDYWICPFCGGTGVAETWELLEGRFRDGTLYGPFGGIDEQSEWYCVDCGMGWTSYENIMLVAYWRGWKFKGKMIKKEDL